MKRVGWRFDPEGASLPASRSSRTVSVDMPSGLNLRILRREAITSDNSNVAPPLIFTDTTTSSWACQMRITITRINTMKKIPTFKTEAVERDFWANADSTDYVNWSKAKRVLLPNIKPSLKTISLRLPELMIDELKRKCDRKSGRPAVISGNPKLFSSRQ